MGLLNRENYPIKGCACSVFLIRVRVIHRAARVRGALERGRCTLTLLHGGELRGRRGVEGLQ